MRVVCTKVVSSTTGELMESSSWLHVDGEYVVLAIEMTPGGRAYFRLIGDNGDLPGLYESGMFMTALSDIPSSWVASVGEEGSVDLAPQRWLRPGFWESYFDRDPNAIVVYQEERDKILAEAELGKGSG